MSSDLPHGNLDFIHRDFPTDAACCLSDLNRHNRLVTDFESAVSANFTKATLRTIMALGLKGKSDLRIFLPCAGYVEIVELSKISKYTAYSP